MKYFKKILIVLALILVIGLVTYFLIRAKPKPKPEEPILNMSLTQYASSGGYILPSFFELQTTDKLNADFNITLTINNSEENGVAYSHSHNNLEEETRYDKYCYCRFANDEVLSPEITGELVVGHTYTATLTLELNGKTFESNALSFEFKSYTSHIFEWQFKTNP